MLKNRNSTLDSLREKAEQLLLRDKNSNKQVKMMEVKRLFHELQVHQLELEMQNDELQNTTAQLEHQQINFSNLFELAPVGYFVTNQTGLTQNVNYAGLKLLDDDKSNQLGRPFILNIFQEDRDGFYRYFRKLFALPTVQSCRIRLINRNKQILNVQIDGLALLNSPTNPICYLTITDFTGKQEAEQKLKETYKTLEMALDASSTGIWEIDLVSGKIYLDDFCRKLFGFDQGNFDVKYETLFNRTLLNDRKNVEHDIRKAILEEKEFNIRFRVNVPDQDLKYVQARGQVVIDQYQKKRFIGIFTDISEKMASKMQASRAKEQQQQMILAAGLQAEENEKKRISEVLHNGIGQMLYGIKLSMGQIEKTSSSPIFDHMADLLDQSIKDIRNISFELAPSILTDYGLAATLEDMAARLSNPQLCVSTKVNNINEGLDFQLQLNIFRIIQELINNSIKHAYASKIAIEVTKKNKVILITVSDNGIGFEQDAETEVPKGIGLSSIKNRLRLYKGSLTIESKPNAGSTISISLKH